MKIRLKIPKQIHSMMLADLKREHPFAYERVGFLFTSSKQLDANTIIVIAKEYVPIKDDNYIEDESVGARIDSAAIRNAMQRILDKKEGCFHVHLHEHMGVPSPSFTDKKGLYGVVRSFANISRNQPNGLLILSENSFFARVKLAGNDHFISPHLISVIGFPLNLHFPSNKTNKRNKALVRQSFLGESSEMYLKNVRVGIVGYGGGGSHIGQQLAHLGVENIIVFDDDKVEESNLNRLIGAWFSDVEKQTQKTSVAIRLIKKIIPKARVNCISNRWQQNPELLQGCDIVFGCVDSYGERDQLEAECRRYLIPYIDIGMDVNKTEDDLYSISGQIILSMPGSPCMRCLGYLTDKKIGLEAAKYGNVGSRPQVVWANGLLASTAVGIFVDLVTGWSKSNDKLVYLAYDGNSGKLDEHIRIKFCDKTCTHHKLEYAGTPVFQKM